MLNPIRTAVYLFVFAYVVATSGCSDQHGISESPTSSAGQRMEKSIAELDTLIAEGINFIHPLVGGTVSLAGSSLEIPSDALLVPTMISAELRDAQPPAGLKEAPRRVFRFFPAGLQFQRNAFLYVAFDDIGIDDRSAYAFRCYYYNEATNQYEVQKTRVDFANRRYIVFIQHFSMYAFGR